MTTSRAQSGRWYRAAPSGHVHCVEGRWSGTRAVCGRYGNWVPDFPPLTEHCPKCVALRGSQEGTALVFLDCETTGLSLDDDIWECAAIRRDPDSTVTRLHMFIEHSTRKCSQLPKPFIDDHQTRFPASDGVGWHPDVVPQTVAAHALTLFIPPRAHIVGAVPNFDTERIALLLRRFGYEPNWHHHLIDVEALALGYLHGIRATGRTHVTIPPLPWHSDDLSRACGVEPLTDTRHTAMGDAGWAMALYDHIMGSTA